GFADAAADRQEVAAVRAEKNAGRLGDRPAKARAGTRPCGGYFRRKVQPAVATRPFCPSRSSETHARPSAKGLRAGAATPSAPTEGRVEVRSRLWTKLRPEAGRAGAAEPLSLAISDPAVKSVPLFPRGAGVPIVMMPPLKTSFLGVILRSLLRSPAAVTSWPWPVGKGAGGAI